MRAHNYGYLSSALPLTPLSATSAASTPGWIVTPSGRVVRPMRMRPERPLEPMLLTSMVKGVNGKVKKRVKPPPVRARRRLIDPTKWDSVYLKGVFLDAVPMPLPASKDPLELPGRVKHDIVDEEDEEEGEGDSTDSDASSIVSRHRVSPSQSVLRLAQDLARAVPSPRQPQEAALATSSRIHETTETIDVRDETSAALAMLGKMFGDIEDWDGRESVDEMGRLEDNEARGKEMQVDEEEDIEIVPRDFGEGERSKVNENKSKGKEKSGGLVRSSHVDEMNGEAARDRDVEMEEIGSSVNIEASAQTAELAPPMNLKALFAPREDGLLGVLFLPILSLKNVLYFQHRFLSLITLTLTSILNSTPTFLELTHPPIHSRRMDIRLNRSYQYPTSYRCLPQYQ